MTTTTYSSESRWLSLYRSALRRNLGTMIYLALAMLFFFPLQYLLELSRQASDTAAGLPWVRSELCGSAGNYTTLSIIAMTMILTAAPVVLTVVQNNYMHSRRAVDLYHSLPVTRVQLMTANAATVFTVVALPLILCHLLVLAIGGSYFLSGAIPTMVWHPGAMLLDLAGWLTATAAIIAVMMLVGALVGSPFENFVLGCELLGAGPVLMLIRYILFQEFLVGYVGKLDPRELAVLTPAALMPVRYTQVELGQSGGFFDLLILGWLAAAAVLFGLALWAYKRRPSELAETSGARGFLGAFIRAVAVCAGGAAIGGIFYGVNGGGKFTFVVGVFLGSGLTVFLMEAVLGRGFRGIRRALPKAAALIAGTTVAALLLVTGGLGFETRVPDPARISSVELDFRGRYGYVSEYEKGYFNRWNNTEDNSGSRYPYYYSYQGIDSVELSGPETLSLVTDYHRALLACNLESVPTEPGSEFYYYFNSRIDYRLSGGEMLRRYRRISREAGELLLELEKSQEFQAAANPILRLTADDLRGLEITDRYALTSSRGIGDPSDLKMVLEALQTDVRQEDYDRYNSGEASVVGYLYLYTSMSDHSQPLEKDSYESFCILILDSYTHTADALRSLGLGEYLEQPDLTEVTAGVNDYCRGYWNQDTLYDAALWIPGSELDAYEYTYEIQDRETLEKLLQAAYHYRVGGQNTQFYLTLSLSGRQGISLGLDWEDLPTEIQEAFPYYVK